ncbi:MAG: hypothetical protein IPM92_17485 [Saprospiraceae bacterium]|nr:hypothetical protein [Saprospiraceae bacterium]
MKRNNYSSPFIFLLLLLISCNKEKLQICRSFSQKIINPNGDSELALNAEMYDETFELKTNDKKVNRSGIF